MVRVLANQNCVSGVIISILKAGLYHTVGLRARTQYSKFCGNSEMGLFTSDIYSRDQTFCRTRWCLEFLYGVLLVLLFFSWKCSCQFLFLEMYSKEDTMELSRLRERSA